jgi:citrate synthase
MAGRSALEAYSNGGAWWETSISSIKKNEIGVSAAIQCELAIPAEAAKGVFALSRGMGIVAHAFEELQNDVLIKGPCPNQEDLVRYSGPSGRHFITIRGKK